MDIKANAISNKHKSEPYKSLHMRDAEYSAVQR